MKTSNKIFIASICGGALIYFLGGASWINACVAGSIGYIALLACQALENYVDRDQKREQCLVNAGYLKGRNDERRGDDYSPPSVLWCEDAVK